MTVEGVTKESNILKLIVLIGHVTVFIKTCEKFLWGCQECSEIIKKWKISLPFTDWSSFFVILWTKRELGVQLHFILFCDNLSIYLFVMYHIQIDIWNVPWNHDQYFLLSFCFFLGLNFSWILFNKMKMQQINQLFKAVDDKGWKYETSEQVIGVRLS